MPSNPSPQMEFAPSLDHRGLDWSTVVRTRYVCHQRFQYTYPGPIRNLQQRLMVTPPDYYGDQEVIEYDLAVAPQAARAHQFTDTFGNRVWELAVEHVESEVVFETSMTVERTTPVPGVSLSKAKAASYFDPTPLTAADERIRAVAHELASAVSHPEALAEQISAWVAGAMQYGSGSTTVETTAAQALTIGRGLCQDYAHVMLALCRTVGLAARYVSGHMVADGGSHAWVEVLLPSETGFRAVGFDPTNRQRPHLGYTVVAVGRDYADVAPTSGRFSAPYGGQLSFSKYARLALVERADGTILEAA